MIHDKVNTEWLEVENNSITFGVLQSLADIQPDVDAIYRLTRETPFNFKRPQPIPTPIERIGECMAGYIHNWQLLVLLCIVMRQILRLCNN